MLLDGKTVVSPARPSGGLSEQDETAGCVVLTGAGRAFATGADISDMLERGVASYADPVRLENWGRIEQFSKPILAAVDGYALGGGLELALICDIIITSEKANSALQRSKSGRSPVMEGPAAAAPGRQVIGDANGADRRDD
jgi:enoyl-CoA hydratase